MSGYGSGQRSACGAGRCGGVQDLDLPAQLLVSVTLVVERSWRRSAACTANYCLLTAQVSEGQDVRSALTAVLRPYMLTFRLSKQVWMSQQIPSLRLHQRYHRSANSQRHR